LLPRALPPPPPSHLSRQGMSEDRKTAQKAQGEISALNKFMSSLDEKFEDYEKGNPYWDQSVTFTLEDQDEDGDGDSSAADEV
jgi:hypothetical protein